MQADPDGPVHFHHVTRQPLGLGIKPDCEILKRLEASDHVGLQWEDEVRRLVRWCKGQRCLIQETFYIIRFEHYRFRQPHSQRAMVSCA